MKIRIWDRLLTALSGLLIVLAGLGLLVFGIGVFPIKLDLTVLEGPFVLWQRAVMVALALLLMALGLHGIGLLFHRRKEKGFVIQQTEFGDMSISMNAMETMVRKCVDSHQELGVDSTHIYHGKDGIMVDLKITLRSGVNIPLTVNALQKQIKQYITSCSGVDVQQVRVMVETDPTAAKLLPGEIPAESILQPAEEPCTAKPCHEETPETYSDDSVSPEPEEMPVEETQEETPSEKADDEQQEEASV